MKPLNKKFLVVLALSALLLMPLAAMATMQEVPLDANGTATQTISSDSGVFATGQWAGTDNFSIMATVTRLQDAGNYVFQYDYVVSADTKDISHVIIGVTAGQEAGTFWKGSVSGWATESQWLTPVVYTAESEGNSNPGMPAYYPTVENPDGVGFTGIKFTPIVPPDDKLHYTFTFYSFNTPVYADFYSKDGQSGGQGGGVDVYAYNKGFGTTGYDAAGVFHPELFTIGPDGSGGQVPIPPTALLLGSGLLGLGLIGWRKRQ
jgi:hypothetical protein